MVNILAEAFSIIKSSKNRLLNLWQGWEPGHFYSPFPDLEIIKEKENEIFNNIPDIIPGVDLNEEHQLRMLYNLKRFYPHYPFNDQKQEKLRFYFDNPNFSYGEAIVLYCMINFLAPKRIIEIGSGYSSCVFLDTNELCFNNSIDCTFIEPYPELFLSLTKDQDLSRIKLIRKSIQNVDTSVFANLQKNDILFIDSSHVSKIDSDVNHEFFRILPSLNKGVYIHFHDINYPFEYPKEWIYQRRVWNEAYILRAFLQYNNRFRIEFFNSYLRQFYNNEFYKAMPDCMKNAGTSIWLSTIF